MRTPQKVGSPNPLDVAMGQNIRLRRQQLGVSQMTLASSIGLTFQQVQKYERGTNRVSFSRLVAIAHVLDCRVVDLVGDLDDRDATQPFKGHRSHLDVHGAADLLEAYVLTPSPLRKAIREFVGEVAKAYAA